MWCLVHEAKTSIFVDWRLMLRGRIAVNLYPTIIAVTLSRVVVLLLFHSNLTHQGIMHIKEAVSLQQHLEIGFPDATIVVLETAAGGGLSP
jgi:hypothetical protein